MRKDATIKVNQLNVNEQTPEGKEAARVINEEIIPRLAETHCKVIVIHKPTNESTSMNVPLIDVQRYAAQAVRAFPRPVGVEPNIDDFVVVEVFPKGTVRVTSLPKVLKDHD